MRICIDLQAKISELESKLEPYLKTEQQQATKRNLINERLLERKVFSNPFKHSALLALPAFCGRLGTKICARNECDVKCQPVPRLLSSIAQSDAIVLGAHALMQSHREGLSGRKRRTNAKCSF